MGLGPEIRSWPGGEPAARQILATKSGALNVVDGQEQGTKNRAPSFAVNYGAKPDGHLEPFNPGGSTPTDSSQEPAMPSGGGGSVTTIEDYYHFAQMLVNGGELAGKRILSPETVQLMSSNHLPAALLNGQFGIGQSVMRAGFGYGFNVARSLFDFL